MSAGRSNQTVAATRCGHWRRGSSALVLAAVMLGLLAVAAAAAQPPSQPSGSAREKLPQPEQIGGNDLLTRDGVQLKATFYPSNKGKDAVPVILLHMWKGDRKEYSSLAPLLHQEGHAVLVPDLRGHGESTTQITAPGRSQPLDAAKFRLDDFARIVTYDMEALKSFLMKKNNAGELNIEKLCVVGGEMGASVALNWAQYDWSWPMLPDKKQGQDVKALVLISPELNFHGLDVSKAMWHPDVRSQLSLLIIVGKGDRRADADARQIYGVFARFHPEPPEAKASDASQQDLFFAALDTKLQGTKMLGVQGINVESGIVGFIDRRLVQRTFAWAARQ